MTPTENTPVVEEKKEEVKEEPKPQPKPNYAAFLAKMKEPETKKEDPAKLAVIQEKQRTSSL